MKKVMLKKSIESLLLFILILFICDRLIGYKLHDIYFKQKKGDFYQTTYAIKNAKEDVLILGSSRALHHYVSSIFQNCINMSTYNLGRDGRNISYAYTVFSQVLTYHHPRVIILDMQPEEFSLSDGKESENSMVYALLPYANYPLIKKSIAKGNTSDLILSKIFWTYPYNSMAVQLVGNYYNLLPGEKNIQGFEPLKGSKITKADILRDKGKLKKKPMDPALINAFQDFLKLAKKNNIVLYVVISPTANLSPYNSIAEIKKLTQQSGFKFYDYSTTINDYSLFYDDTHLNIKGATLFTDTLANELKKNFPNKLASIQSN
jgi:hypothetical protein